MRIATKLRTLLCTTALAMAPVAAASAQSGNEFQPPVPYSRIISVNPLLLVFSGIISLDYEHRISSSTTLGGSVANFDLSDANYLTFEARARYYVSGRAMDGISVGAITGLVRLAEDTSDVRDYALSVGFVGERQWLLGVDERVAITAGAGASRLFFVEDRDAFRRVLPTLRLSVGWGF